MKHEFTILRRLWLFVRIVWRHDQTGFRMSRTTAWEVSKIVWPGREHMAETRTKVDTRKFAKMRLASTQMQTMGKFREQIKRVFGNWPDDTPLMFEVEFRLPPEKNREVSRG